MMRDEHGNEFSQCVNCQTVYLPEQSFANVKYSFCSTNCEDRYLEFLNDLHDEFQKGE